MLVNKSLAGKQVATEFGTITFNDKGESKDLKTDQEKLFAEFEGFSVVEKKDPKEKTEIQPEAPTEEKKPTPKKKKVKED